MYSDADLYVIGGLQKGEEGAKAQEGRRGQGRQGEEGRGRCRGATEEVQVRVRLHHLIALPIHVKLIYANLYRSEPLSKAAMKKDRAFEKKKAAVAAAAAAAAAEPEPGEEGMMAGVARGDVPRYVPPPMRG